MVRVKRLRSVCHSIAHHATSGLSWVHPHVLRACEARGLSALEVNLLDDEPCPQACLEIEPLKLSLRGVKSKLREILSTEGMTIEDLTQASLTFIRAPEARDDYNTVCRAQLAAGEGIGVNVAVDFMGNTRTWTR